LRPSGRKKSPLATVFAEDEAAKPESFTLLYGANTRSAWCAFSTETYTRGCHWIPRIRLKRTCV
jgi:hypothetical protein